MATGKGKRLSDAYIELRADDSKLSPDVKVKATKVGREFGGALNRQLKTIGLDPIDIKADPKSALAAIELTERRLEELSGDAATVEVKVRTERARGELARFKKRLGDVGDDSAGGFFAAFSSRLGPMMAKLPISGPLAIGLAAVGVAVAPVIGSAVAGAVIGGAGIGGVAGGLLIASKDSRVQAAAKATAASIGGQLEDAALPFVDGAMDGLAILEQGFNEVSGNVRSILSNAATFVRPLASGVTDFLSPIVQGVDALVAKASPVIEAIRLGLGEIGQAIGDVFTDLQDNGVEAGMAISLVMKGIAGTIRVVGAIINGLTEAFGFLIDLADKLGFLTDDGKRRLDAMRGATDQMTGSAQAGKSGFAAFDKVIEDMGTTTAATTSKFVALDQEIADSVNKNLGAADAILQLRTAVAAASSAVDKKRRVSTEETQALLGLARAANSSTTALDAQGRTVQQATHAHEANRKKLIEVAIKMGYTKDQAKRLADQYLAIPKGVATAIQQPGMPQSRRQVRDYHTQLDRLARTIKTTVSVHGDRVAYAKLERLLIQQQALKRGISVSAASSAFRKQEAQAFAAGGEVGGPGTGTSDSVLIRASHGEWVQPAGSVDYYGARAMEAIRTRSIPREMLAGYAAGGPVISAPFQVTAAVTRIPSMQEALAAVAGQGGLRPQIAVVLGALRQMFGAVPLISGVREGARTLSGSVSRHALGLAFDTSAVYPWGKWLHDVWGSRLLELITPWRELNMWHGRPHRFSYAVEAQHGVFGRNRHIHAAMDDGGPRVLMPGLNVIPNNTGRPEPIAALDRMPAGEVHFHFHGPVASKRAAQDMVLEAYQALVRSRKIPAVAR